VAPYLSLLPEDAAQRRHELRRVFDALKRDACTRAPSRALPHEVPPWPIVCQHARRWVATSVFVVRRLTMRAMVHDLRLLLRDLAGRKTRPTAVILDSRALQSTPGAGTLRAMTAPRECACARESLPC
jgi:hypothetical protein